MLQNIVRLGISFLLLSVVFTVGCSGQQTEEQALRSLREMTRDGKLPPEDFVVGLESRFAGKKTGALAKLLHARIRFENNDFAGAAVLLNSDIFRKKTNIADYALWLRGRSLGGAKNYNEATKVFENFIHEYPDSTLMQEARLWWARAATLGGRAVEVPPALIDLIEKDDVEALNATAEAYEAQGSRTEAIKYFRRSYFYGVGKGDKDYAVGRLIFLNEPRTAQTADEQLALANKFLDSKRFAEAAVAYTELTTRFALSVTPALELKKITASGGAGKMADAQTVFNSMSPTVKEKEEAYRQLVLGYSKAKMWPQARSTADEMRQKFPNGTLVAKTFVDAGLAARDAKNRTEESYFLNTAVASFPNAVEVAQAQFETAWMQHESKNFSVSSTMFVEHLARYADKDTTNRGKAGYWAARDSQRAGKTAEACALYDAVLYRYSANWYGYLAFDRLTTMKNQGNCRSTSPPNELVAKAAANLKIVTVAAETATEKESNRAEKSQELTTIGLFDWAIDELQEAKKTANNSPKINLALAQHYTMKGDRVNALLSLQKSYPDSAQMFPEEMGREEWAIFYPLTNWNEITRWANARSLDRYQVAGVIRQETIFDPNAASHAKAYGLMQLLLPTAQATARKYGTTVPTSASELYDPRLNIELGTAYMKDQFAKFGRIEYVAIAYNAGPGRVNPWRATLPPEMDEFVEAIPFKETKAYVQGVIRNSAQYRRLYDDNGNFKPNVGTRPLRGEIDTKPRDQFVAVFPEVNVDDNRASE